MAAFGAAGADGSAVRLHVQKCFSPLVLLMLLPVQTWQSFGLTPPPVSHLIFYFQMNIKISQAERIVLFCFDWCLLGFF